MGVYSNKRIREGLSAIYFNADSPNTVMLAFKSAESCYKAKKHMEYVLNDGETLYLYYVFSGINISKGFSAAIKNKIVESVNIISDSDGDKCLCIKYKDADPFAKLIEYCNADEDAVKETYCHITLSIPMIEKVIFNPPATIVIWNDGSKTVVKCKEGDNFNKEIGLAMCITRKYFGSRHRFEKCVEKYGSEVSDQTPLKDTFNVDLNMDLSQHIYEALMNVFTSPFKNRKRKVNIDDIKDENKTPDSSVNLGSSCDDWDGDKIWGEDR